MYIGYIFYIQYLFIFKNSKMMMDNVDEWFYDGVKQIKDIEEFCEFYFQMCIFQIDNYIIVKDFLFQCIGKFYIMVS